MSCAVSDAVSAEYDFTNFDVRLALDDLVKEIATNHIDPEKWDCLKQKVFDHLVDGSTYFAAMNNEVVQGKISYQKRTAHYRSVKNMVIKYSCIVGYPLYIPPA